MERFEFRTKKVRGVARRLRALAKWAANFGGAFPIQIAENDRYRNYKLPVLLTMVDGKQAIQIVRRECAQRLIDACENLIKSRPSGTIACRVVATITLPDMFASEVCIYVDESYFRTQTQISSDQYGSTTTIAARSLVSEWGLKLPSDMCELGVRVEQDDRDDESQRYVSEHWFLGEVG